MLRGEEWVVRGKYMRWVVSAVLYYINKVYLVSLILGNMLKSKEVLNNPFFLLEKFVSSENSRTFAPAKRETVVLSDAEYKERVLWEAYIKQRSSSTRSGAAFVFYNRYGGEFRVDWTNRQWDSLGYRIWEASCDRANGADVRCACGRLYVRTCKRMYVFEIQEYTMKSLILAQDER